MMHQEIRLRDFFTNRVCDVTPSAADSTTHVLFAPFSASSQTTNWCRSILSRDERNQLERLANDKLRSRFAQRRAFARYCVAVALNTPEPLSQIRIVNDPKGRPSIPGQPGLSLSFSSCRFGIMGAWSATGDIGVDIEDATRPIDAVAMAEAYYSKAETRAVEATCTHERNRMFYRLWSLKEAALKSIGQGLPYGMHRFVFDLAESARCIAGPADCGDIATFSACEIEIENVSAALAEVPGR